MGARRHVPAFPDLAGRSYYNARARAYSPAGLTSFFEGSTPTRCVGGPTFGEAVTGLLRTFTDVRPLPTAYSASEAREVKDMPPSDGTEEERWDRSVQEAIAARTREAQEAGDDVSYAPQSILTDMETTGQSPSRPRRRVWP